MMKAPTITCDRCGNAVSADEVFCTYCHYRLPEFDFGPRQVAQLVPESEAPPAVRLPWRIGNWWKPALAGFVAVVVIVVAAVVVLSGGDDAPTVKPALVELSEQPTQQWSRPLDGEAAASLVVDDTVYLLLDGGLTALALETTTGRQRWTAGINGEAGNDARIAALGDRIAVLLGSGDRSTSTLTMLDARTGDVRWEADIAYSASLAWPIGLLVEAPADGRKPGTVQVIDDAQQSLGEAVTVDRWYTTDDAAFIDVDSTLQRVVPVNGPSFSYEHAGHEIGAVGTTEGNVFVGADDRVVQLSSIGEVQWSVSGRVGRLLALKVMDDDRLLVVGIDGLRVISSVDGADVVVDPRQFSSALVGAGPGGHDVVFAASAAGASGPLAVLSTGNGRFTRIAEISGFRAPLVQSSGQIVYVSEVIPSNDVEQRLLAVELPGGRRLWEMPLQIGAVASVTADGIVIIDNDGQASSVSFYSD